MGTEGRGNHPLISSWFVPRYNPPSKSLHIMRQSVGIDRGSVGTVIWSYFFFEEDSVAITGDVALAQSAQGILASGQEDFSATVVTDQAAQAMAIVGTVATVSAPAVRPERYVVGLPSEVHGRPRRQVKIGTRQKRQEISSRGTVFMPIVGISLMTTGEQHIKAVGNKNTFERDMRLVLELVDLEVA